MERLFKGKRKDNGEWVEGYLIWYEDGRARIVPRHTDIFCYSNNENLIQTTAYEVIPETVGPYTGITDKNKKKVFKGDIVASAYDSVRPDDICFELIVWYQNSWCTKEGDAIPDKIIGETLEYSQIVGNVYDNPELIGGTLRVKQFYYLSSLNTASRLQAVKRRLRSERQSRR